MIIRGYPEPDFHKGLVAEMMKVETLYRAQGLQLRVERLADYDGFRLGAKVPGREPLFFDVPCLPEGLGYAQITEAIDKIRGYMDGAALQGRTLLAKPVLADDL